MEEGRYRLVEKIGQGGMATVWRAEDTTLRRAVAVKCLLPGMADRGEPAERFAREARVLAGIRHANVLQLHDYLPADGEAPARLVMELLSGPPLHRFVVEAGAPLPEVAALIGAEVAAGLAAAHALGIVHRDVKPENVILDGGRVVLTDFGVARVTHSERTALTHTGAIIGSPAYMSPEQARGEEVDARSDQFSFGAMLYFLASGAAPFSASHPLAVMQKIERSDYQPLGARNPRVPGWLDRVVTRCLQHAPASRFADVSALANALRAGLADDGLADPAAELRAYFADPPAYNAALPARVVAARMERAERAVASGPRARALAHVGRVLEVEPGHARARALLQQLERGARGWIAVAGVVLVAAASVGMRAWLHAHATRVAPTPVVAVVAPTVIVPPPVEEPKPIAVAEPAPRTPSIRKATRTHAAVEPEPVSPSPPPSPSPSTSPSPSPFAQLTVRTAPWCELSVDGQVAGRTPQTLHLPAGRHALSCVNPSGARLDRTIELTGGADRTIEERLGSALLTPSLARGDAITFDADAASSAPRHAAPGRHRVTLLKSGAQLDARWIDLPPGGCRLVDTPALACEIP